MVLGMTVAIAESRPTAPMGGPAAGLRDFCNLGVRPGTGDKILFGFAVTH